MPELSVTFNLISAEYQEVILVLQDINPKALGFYMLNGLCHMISITGYVIDCSRNIILTETYLRNFKVANDSIFSMHIKKLSATDAYNAYLKDRASMLNLNSSTAEDLAIARICNIIRADSPEKALEVKESFYSQSKQIKDILTEELTKDGISNKGIRLYNAHKTLLNAVTFFIKAGYKDAVSQALYTVLPIFTDVYKYARERISRDNNSSQVCTVFIGELAEKARNPFELYKYNLDFIRVGQDYNVECIKYIEE